MRGIKRSTAFKHGRREAYVVFAVPHLEEPGPGSASWETEQERRPASVTGAAGRETVPSGSRSEF